MAKKEFIVAHPKFSIKCKESGKMKRVEKGTRISLEESAAKKAGRRLVCAKSSEVVDVETKAPAKASGKSDK